MEILRRLSGRLAILATMAVASLVHADTMNATEVNRWYMPGALGEETMPYDLPLTGEPDFIGRNILGDEMGKKNGYGGLYTPGGQVWCYLVPPSRYFKTHPEYYALVDGERIPCSPHRGQLCTSNPKVAVIMARKIIRYMNENPDEIVPLSPNDNGDFCECQECRALDVKPGQLADRLIQFYNEVATIVEKKHPARKMTFLAYANYTEPPVKEKPHRNLIPQICRIEPYGYGISDQRLEKLIQGWCRLCPTVSTYEYVGDWRWFGFYPMLREFQRNLQIYKENGVDIVCAECHPHWATQGLNIWAAQRLVWDCEQDLDALIADYCKGMYHAAAEPMVRFFSALEDESWRFDSNPSYARKFFTRPFMRELNECLAEAETLAKGDKVALQRLALARKGYQFTERWSAGWGSFASWMEDGRNRTHLVVAIRRMAQALKIAESVGDSGFQIELVRLSLNGRITKEAKLLAEKFPARPLKENKSWEQKSTTVPLEAN